MVQKSCMDGTKIKKEACEFDYIFSSILLGIVDHQSIMKDIFN